MGISEQFKSLRLTVVGLGLMGGSFVKALRPLGLAALNGIDMNTEVLNAVLRAKLVDRASSDSAGIFEQTDLLIICLPPAAAVEFVLQNQYLLPEGAIITDVCGVKAPMMQQLLPHLRKDLSYVPGHPMCGREVGGFSRSHHELYLGCNYILAPVAGSERGLVLVEELARNVGAMNIIHTSIYEHDEKIALTSHLPHIVASCLIHCTEDIDQVEDFTGGSFRDATRVAAMNARMWTELFLSNKDALLNQMDNFTDSINSIRKALECSDSAQLERLLAESSDIKETFI